MKALVEDMKNDIEHPGQPTLVVSDNINANGLEFAKQNSIETFVVNTEKDQDLSIFETMVINILKKKKIELICLAGFMKILSESFIEQFSKPILNIHPSLLPAFKGLNTHEKALKSGCLIHGATVHQITEKLDDGPILGQIVIKIPEKCTPEELKEKLLPKEHKIYKQVLREVLKGSDKKIIQIETTETFQN